MLYLEYDKTKLPAIKTPLPVEKKGIKKIGAIHKMNKPINAKVILCQIPALNIRNFWAQLKRLNVSVSISVNAPGYSANKNIPKPFKRTFALNAAIAWPNYKKKF